MDEQTTRSAAPASDLRAETFVHAQNEVPGACDATANQERRRLHELFDLRILDTPPDETLDRLTGMAARLFDVPIAAVSLVDQDRLWLKSATGVDARELPRSQSFCDHLVACHMADGQDLLVVPDATQSPHFATSRFVTQAPHLRFYAGVPLLTDTGQAIGSFCVMDATPHEPPDEGKLAMLRDLASLAMDAMQSRRRSERARRTAECLAQIHDMLRAMALAADTKAASLEAAHHIRNTIAGSFCALYELQPETGHAALLAASCARAAQEMLLHQWAERGLHAQNSMIGRAMVSGVPVAIADVTGFDFSLWPATQALMEAGNAALAMMPLELLGRSIGVVVGYDTTIADFETRIDTLRDMVHALTPLVQRLQADEEAALFRRAVEHLPDAVLITEARDLDGPGPSIIYCNPAFEAETQYRRSDVIGRSPRFLQGELTSVQARAAIRQALAAGRPVRQTLVNYRADGAIRHIGINIAPLRDQAGRCTHFVAVQRDITPQIEASERHRATIREMQAMFDAMPGAMLRLGLQPDGSWKLLFVSPSIEALSGFRSAEAVQPGWLSKRLQASDLKQFEDHLRQAGDGSTASPEFRFLHRDGRICLIQARVRGFRTHDGGRHAVCILSDVTRERGLSAQLAQAVKLAELGELVAGLAHEMNQPLAAISLAAENAMRAMQRLPDTTQRVSDKLNTIYELSQRAAGLIQHMRVFARMDGGELVDLALPHVVKDTMMLLQAKLHETSVALSIDIPPDLPRIRVRPIALEQILVNLVINACDAYAEGKTRLAPGERVVRLAAEERGGRVVVTVRDRAGGIEPSALPHVFEPFFTTKPSGKGTGLGLSISASLMKEMGGSISVMVQGGGAVFRLELPVAD